MYARIFPDVPMGDHFARVAIPSPKSKFVEPDNFFEVLARTSREHKVDEIRRVAIAYVFSEDGSEHVPIAEFDEEQLVRMVSLRQKLLKILFANWEDKTSIYSVLQNQTRLLEEAALELRYLEPSKALAKPCVQ